MTDQLRKIVEKATPGPWQPSIRPDFDSTVIAVGHPNAPTRPRAVCVMPRYGREQFEAHDAAHIAAFDPPMARALLDCKDALRERVKYGHNDTCGAVLSSEPYPCSCGQDAAVAALAAFDALERERSGE